MENLKNLLSDPFNVIFGFVLIILFIRFKSKPLAYQTLPQILVAIGILGTFTGIFIGLLNFDTREIDKSVPLLLDGLKTAFFTSVLGLGFSTWIKIQHSVRKFQNPSQPEQNKEYSLETIFGTFKAIGEDLRGIKNWVLVSCESLSKIESAHNGISSKMDFMLEALNDLKDQERCISVELGPKLKSEFDEMLESSRQIAQLAKKFDLMISAIEEMKTTIKEKRFRLRLKEELQSGAIQAFENIELQGSYLKDLYVKTIPLLELLGTDGTRQPLIEIMENIESIDNSMEPIIEELQNIKNKIIENK